MDDILPRPSVDCIEHASHVVSMRIVFIAWLGSHMANVHYACFPSTTLVGFDVSAAFEFFRANKCF